VRSLTLPSSGQAFVRDDMGISPRKTMWDPSLRSGCEDRYPERSEGSHSKYNHNARASSRAACPERSRREARDLKVYVTDERQHHSFPTQLWLAVYWQCRFTPGTKHKPLSRVACALV
jgi:hypothetical protein